MLWCEHTRWVAFIYTYVVFAQNILRGEVGIVVQVAFRQIICELKTAAVVVPLFLKSSLTSAAHSMQAVGT